LDILIDRFEKLGFSFARFAEKFQRKICETLIFWFKSGIMAPAFSKTRDGFESQMAVNYFTFSADQLLFPS